MIDWQLSSTLMVRDLDTIHQQSIWMTRHVESYCFHFYISGTGYVSYVEAQAEIKQFKFDYLGGSNIRRRQLEQLRKYVSIPKNLPVI